MPARRPTISLKKSVGIGWADGTQQSFNDPLDESNVIKTGAKIMLRGTLISATDALTLMIIYLEV
jgi:hypothetical protein